MLPQIELLATAYSADQLPRFAEAQIALVGRSNVGKSSLLNALGGRKSLAKVSATPGKTRSINFYKVLPFNFYLVDLPGYGYARASHAERQHWAEVLEHYLAECGEMKLLVLLLDCRLTPQRLDLDLVRFARAANLPLLPVLTKSDKCSQRERQSRQGEWLNIVGIRPLCCSAQKRQGLEKLWRAMLKDAFGEEQAERMLASLAPEIAKDAKGNLAKN